MKFFRFTLVLSYLLLSASCQHETHELGVFKVLPMPQEMTINGVSDLKYSDIQNYYTTSGIELPVLGTILESINKSENPTEAQVFFSIDAASELPDEGYTLVISKVKVSMVAKDKAGLFYAFQTLQQLMIDAEEQGVNLPACEITDYPLLEYRAVHWDVKHHMEKPSYYFQLIDKLASYKVNGILVEVEDKIKYVRQPTVASPDAMSIEDWKQLSDYAKARHIDMSPLVQGLGHASFVLKHDVYKDLRDDPENDWAFNPLDEKTYEVQFDLYRDAIEAMPDGQFLHVGGDEVHTTGRNSGRSSLDLQLDWLNRVCEFAESQGRIPIFWDDMPLKDAGLWNAMFNVNLTSEEIDSLWSANAPKLVRFLDKYPKNCIYMRWNYSSPEALGNEKAMAWFRENGMRSMGATAGQTRWVLMPQNESNMDNIKTFALSSINSDQKGLLLTLWDDDSPHFELYNRGIIAFAEYTWSGEKRTKDELKTAYRQREFSNAAAGPELAFIDQLEGPVGFWKNALLNGNRRNYLKSNALASEKFVIDLPDPEQKGVWSKKHEPRLASAKHVVAVCDSVGDKILQMKSLAHRNAYTLEVYEQVNTITRFTASLLLKLERYDQEEDSNERSKILNDIKSSRTEFNVLRSELEAVYGKTRILHKPDSYILDQDHHVHLANQSLNFDWQFLAELLFFDKIEATFQSP